MRESRAMHARIAVSETIWHQEQTPCRSHARRGGSGPVAIAGRPHSLLAAALATILQDPVLRLQEPYDTIAEPRAHPATFT